MSQDHVAGAMSRAKGTVKEVAGDLTGDTKWQAEGAADRAVGNVQDTIGSVKDAGRDAVDAATEESPQEELSHMRAELDQISAETAATQARAQAYARRADAALNQQTEVVAKWVRGYPLLSVGGAAIAGFLFGRLMSGSTYVYRR